MSARRGWICAALLLALVGCDGGARYDQAVAVLIDVSGTYADRRGATVELIKRQVLPDLVPGDTLLVLRIDSESYDEDDLVALATLDPRPSRANAQKLALARTLDRFAAAREPASHTDIPGAILLASEYLREIGAGSSTILVFSDMQTDLPVGARRSLDPGELAGIHVAAVNVKRLPRDSSDPQTYRARLERWQKELARAGAAEWRAILDPARLPPYLKEIRG